MIKAKRVKFLSFLSVTTVSMSLASLCWAKLDLCNEVGTLPKGTDESFYYSSELRYGQDLASLSVWMKRLNEALRAKGVLLVTVPIPSRGMANGEVITDEAALKTLEINFSAAEATAYYRDYVASLEPTVAVDLLDAARTFSGDVGYQQKLDRHWTPEGAQASAQAVARVLRSNSVYQTLAESSGLTKFETTWTGTEPGGNEFFELIEKKCGDQPNELMETINLYETKQVGGGDLFAVEEPIVAVAGDSFSAKPYNFDGFLSEALERPVLNISVYGGGLDSALQDLLLKRETAGNPKVIVWEYRMKDAISTEREGDYTAFRQMIPSVYGACTPETALASGNAEVTGETVDLLTATNPDVYGEDYYLHLQASDLSLVKFEIVSKYEDGSVDRATINRSTRGRNTGEYYLELSRDISSPLREVSFNVPAGITGTIDAQVCRAP